MAISKRKFKDAISSQRCSANARWDGELVQCGRRQVRDGLCWQHWKICSCPKECDCESPNTNPALKSEECPEHNLYPKPAPECRVHI